MTCRIAIDLGAPDTICAKSKNFDSVSACFGRLHHGGTMIVAFRRAVMRVPRRRAGVRAIQEWL
jgi:hypothetical protein